MPPIWYVGIFLGAAGFMYGTSTDFLTGTAYILLDDLLSPKFTCYLTAFYAFGGLLFFWAYLIGLNTGAYSMGAFSLVTLVAFLAVEMTRVGAGSLVGDLRTLWC